MKVKAWITYRTTFEYEIDVDEEYAYPSYIEDTVFDLHQDNMYEAVFDWPDMYDFTYEVVEGA